MTPHFRLPLNLPHAGTIANRIVDYLERRHGMNEDAEMLIAVAKNMAQRLDPYRHDGENPPAEEAEQVKKEVTRTARGMVGMIEKLKIGDDRLGMHIRNFFECLELGEEGAEISLRAGENPDSPQRPV